MGKDAVPDLLQHAEGVGVAVAVWPTVPEGVLVELQGVDGNAAVVHGSEASVAYGQCLFPVGGGALVPENVVVVVLRSGGGRYAGCQKEGSQRAKGDR